jgi:hypothetical protein
VSESSKFIKNNVFSHELFKKYTKEKLHFFSLFSSVCLSDSSQRCLARCVYLFYLDEMIKCTNKKNEMKSYLCDSMAAATHVYPFKNKLGRLLCANTTGT